MYTDWIVPIAPARGPGPAMIGTPQCPRCATTSASGVSVIKQIARARGRSVRDEAGHVVGLVQIDLLLAEAQRRAALAEGDDLHTENSRVELTGRAISA